MYSFEDIAGQQHIVRHMQDALQTGAVSHAYILCGERGSGKQNLAMAFAAALLCTDPQEKDGMIQPCGRCHSCLQAASGSHPDLLVFRHQKKNDSDKRSALGADDARRLRSDVQIKPYYSSRKIYIVPEADRMTPQAQNVLLKTLEEPPAYAVILLLAEGTEKFLPTVLSRCILMRLRPVPEKELVSYLTDKCGADPASAGMAARLSGGNPGRASQILGDEESGIFIKEAEDFLSGLDRAGAYEIAQFAEKVCADEDKGKDRKKADREEEGAQEEASMQDRAGEFYEIVQNWYRDLLVAKSSEDPDSLIFMDKVQYIKDAAERLSYEKLMRMQDAITLAGRRMDAGAGRALVLQMLLLGLRDCLGRD